MAIDVYWACSEDEWLRAEAPVNVRKLNFSLDSFKKTNDVIRCPATIDFLHNYYGIKSIYEYEFMINDDNSVLSKYYNQYFYENHILIRNIESKAFTFRISNIFFTENDSLIMSQEQPFLEDNNINDRCIIYPGKFDIGKWFRDIEFSFKLKKNVNEFKIIEDEIYCYLKFHTQEDINFIQFRMSTELRSLANDVINAKHFQPKKYRSLEYRYESFSTKQLILQEIKKNILT